MHVSNIYPVKTATFANANLSHVVSIKNKN